MRFVFALLRRFGPKFIEVVGAGLISALFAYWWGRPAPPAPVPPPPAIVQVLPPSDDAIRIAREEHALLTQLVRQQAENQKSSENTFTTPPPAPTKAAKPTQAGQARRNQKREQAAGADLSSATEPLAIQPPRTTPNPVPKGQSAATSTAHDEFTTIAPASGEAPPILERLKQTLFPDNGRIFGELPRPPMAVGQFVPSEM